MRCTKSWGLVLLVAIWLGGMAPAARAEVLEACVRVWVQGAVRHPGGYDMPVGARCFDAIQRAGGLAPDGVPAGLSLAQVVTDGETIRVLRRGERMPAPQAIALPPPRSSRRAASHRKQLAPGEVIHLNTAPEEGLEQLPGVGPRLALDILTYRKAHGGFRSLTELREIRGIGEKRLARWQGHLAL